MKLKHKAFTIIELLITIVIIAILVAITTVVYVNMTSRAQYAAMQAESKQFTNKLEESLVGNGQYPTSITDCPVPSGNNLCLRSSVESVNYKSYSPSSSSTWMKFLDDNYDLSMVGDKTFVYVGVGQRTSTGTEFMQYVDLAPLIDKYGIRPYRLSFDIKSADTSKKNTVNAYFQNGSNTRYLFSLNVPVTEEYSHKSYEITPSVSNLGIEKAMLAFYGTYDTGNRPIVKNVRFELVQ